MSEVPEDLRYTKEHEWVRMREGRAVVGITDHAQAELTDVVYVELPDVGAEFSAGQDFAVVESVKAASEVYAPVAGEVVEVNEELGDHPELVNDSPYEKGWLAIFDPKENAEVDALLSAAQYRATIEETAGEQL